MGRRLSTSRGFCGKSARRALSSEEEQTADVSRLQRSGFPPSGGAGGGQCYRRDHSVAARARVRQRARGGRHVPFYVDLLLVPRTTARNRTRRPFLGATEAAIGVSRARARWRASLRADFARSSARELRLAPRDGARPRSSSRRAPRFDSSRVPAIPRSRLFQNRRPRARPAGTTRFSSSPLSSPSPPSFLPSDSYLACHPTALSTAPNPDADSSRRGLAVTTPIGFAGAVGRFTPSPSCTSSLASPSSATTSSHHRSSSSARD